MRTRQGKIGRKQGGCRRERRSGRQGKRGCDSGRGKRRIMDHDTTNGDEPNGREEKGGWTLKPPLVKTQSSCNSHWGGHKVVAPKC